MLSSSLMLSSGLMHRVARNPAAGARGPAGGVWLGMVVRSGDGSGDSASIRGCLFALRLAPAGPRAPAAGLRATRCIRLLDKDRLVDNIRLLNKFPEEYLFKNPG